MPASRYRTKPVEIEAMQFTGVDTSRELFEWMDTGGAPFEVQRTKNRLMVNTDEGFGYVYPGGFVIRLGNGLFEWCSESAFAERYELVSEAPQVHVHVHINADTHRFVDEALRAARYARYDDWRRLV